MSVNAKQPLSGKVSFGGSVQGNVSQGTSVVSDERIAAAVEAYMTNNPVPYPYATVENNILKVTFGIPDKEISCIKFEGPPTESTVGAVGLLGIDTLTGDVYKCVAVVDGIYTWEPLSRSVDLTGYVKSVNGKTPDENGNVDASEIFIVNVTNNP